MSNTRTDAYSTAGFGSTHDLTLDEITAPSLIKALAYWRSKTPAGAPYPARADIDPVDVPRLLPHFALAEVHRMPELLFRFRVFGSYLRETFQFDASGLWVTRDSLGVIAPHIHEDFERLLNHGAPLAVERSNVQPSREFLRYQVLDMPLGTPEEGITMILSCLERV